MDAPTLVAEGAIGLVNNGLLMYPVFVNPILQKDSLSTTPYSLDTLLERSLVVYPTLSNSVEVCSCL